MTQDTPTTLGLLPIIDFTGFDQGNAELDEKIGKQFFEACRDVGFAYLTNTGITDDDVNTIFDWSRRFHSLPDAAKAKCKILPRTAETPRCGGYSGIGQEQVTRILRGEDNPDKNSGDNKQSFDVQTRKDADGSYHYPNMWPDEEDLPGFRVALQHWSDLCSAVRNKALTALSIGMPGIDKGFFDSYHSHQDNYLRLLHYPSLPWPETESPDNTRTGAHTDFGTLTLLFQDNVGGLEVEDPKRPGVFVPAPPVTPSTCVFNIGDLLQRWSNDGLRSTTHRVAPPHRTADSGPLQPERFSLPYFCGADAEAVVKAIPGTFSEANRAKYPPISVREYVDKHVLAMYATEPNEGISQ